MKDFWGAKAVFLTLSLGSATTASTWTLYGLNAHEPRKSAFYKWLNQTLDHNKRTQLETQMKDIVNGIKGTA